MHDFHHQLLGFERVDHVLAHGLGLDRVSKLFGYLIIDVGIEQCPAHIFHGLGHIYLGDFALAFEYLE